LLVDKQVLFSFTISKYKYNANILCDIMFMKTSHLLLERPCEFDRGVIHYGDSN